jgi:hypothetical protein
MLEYQKMNEEVIFTLLARINMFHHNSCQSVCVEAFKIKPIKGQKHIDN